MITVDLEKKLMKEHKQVFTPQELLQIKEYEQLGELVENDALQRVGIVGAAENGKNNSAKLTAIKERLGKFDQDRIFHRSQIKSICDKYHLKFLSPRYYQGTVDGELANRITNFETAYGVRCGSSNTKIVAPASSFKLQERPKDPLFFYSLGDGYYYLIHKWGNDLNIFRRMIPLFTNVLFCSLLIGLGGTALAFAFGFLLSGMASGIAAGSILAVMMAIFLPVWAMFNPTEKRWSDPIRFLKPNEWTDEYID